MSVNPEVKGTLAKLLATENLNVEHRAVSTAYFDVVNRTLCLPIWKNVSSYVYDMLVGHEVGHALYTPLDYIDASKDVPQDILNVLEDVRVEKLMKRRYPGLSKSFYVGYNELDQKDFFELKDKDLSKMSFIDRINVHYKIGVIGNRTIVPFEREELEFVNRAADTESFDDVIQLGKDLLEFLKMKKEQQKVDVPNPPQSSAGGGSQPEEGNNEQVGPSSSDSVQNNSNSSNQPDFERDQSTQDESDSTLVGGRQYQPDENISETYRALTENQKELVDRRAKDYVYINTPQFNLNQTIVPFKKTVADFIRWSANAKQDQYQAAQNKYIKYKKDSIKTVNYLVKEFECKKAADQYSRASSSRTGVLDTAKLHTYKFSDDIFKKVTTIPDGKNHGLVFYLDWSGSMSAILSSTMNQLYDLIWFCKKVSIPFRVYAFSDASHNDTHFPGCPTDNIENTIHVDDCFRLFEFFSSKMNAQTLDKMMSMMYVNALGSSPFGGETNNKYYLSGTPLVEAILTTPQVVEKFKSEEKVQKVNVVYLSDGESAYPMYNKYVEVLKSVHRSAMHGYYASDVFVLKEPKSRYQSQIDCENGNITNQFVKYISNIVDYNLLGFRLCSRLEVRNQARYSNANMEVVAKEWDKFKAVALSGCGFKQLYLMQTPKVSYYYGGWNHTETENQIEVKDPSSKSQLANAFKKHMNGKMVNKTILSKFISQIA